MKRNKMLRLAAILMALVLATSIALTGTLAKYVAKAEMRGLAARVAAFRVLVNGVDITIPTVGGQIPLVGLLEANRKLQADMITRADDNDADSRGYNSGHLKDSLNAVIAHDDYKNQLWMARYFADTVGDNSGILWNQFTAEDAAYWNGVGNRPDWGITAGGYAWANDVEWVIFPGTGMYGVFEIQNLSEVPVQLVLTLKDAAEITPDLPVEFKILGVNSDTVTGFGGAGAPGKLLMDDAGPWTLLSATSLNALTSACNVALPAWNGLPATNLSSNLNACTKTILIGMRWAFNDYLDPAAPTYNTTDPKSKSMVSGFMPDDAKDSNFGASAAYYVQENTESNPLEKPKWGIRSSYAITSSPYASDYMDAIQSVGFGACTCLGEPGGTGAGGVIVAGDPHLATCPYLLSIKDSTKIPGFNLKNFSIAVTQID